MRTNVGIDLNDAERILLGSRVRGGTRPITRKELNDLVHRLIKAELAGPSATVMRTFACPKCNRPISLNVPR